MGEILKRLSRWRLGHLRVLMLAVLSLIALSAPAFAAPPPDAATQQAIDLTFDIAKPALAAAGVKITDEEERLVKSVMACALQGSSLETCGRGVLVDQLKALPAPAADLTDCLLQGNNVQTCGQQAVVKALVPKELQPTANCLAGAAINNGPVLDCVRQSVVSAIPDKSVGQIADCLLRQRPVAECASGPLISQLPPDLAPVAQCLIEKQPQSAAQLAQCAPAGLGSLPPELKCLANQATAQSCLEQTMIDRLPLDQSQKDLAKCMMDPAAAAQCAKDKLASTLPPGIADTADCIAKAQNPARCAKTGTGSLGDALDTLSKVMGNTQLVDPGHAPSSLANLVKVADAIRHDRWGDVMLYGGAELYKAAAKIVLNEVLPAAIPGLGELLAILAGPIVDTMVQDRIELVSALLVEAKKCSRLDPSRCDAAKIGELLGEFYLLMQIEVPCSLLSQLPPVVRQVTCGPLGDAIVAVGSAAYDFYKNNDKELAAIAAILFPGSGIAEAIIALDPDFQNFLIGKNGECPANYFSSHMAICFKDVAYLSMVDSRRAADLTKSINDACHQDFKSCSQRNAAGKALDCIGGLFGGNGCHADDSDRIAKHCDPAMNALAKAAADLRARVEALASEYAAVDPLKFDDICSMNDEANGFIARCARALPSKLPGINGPNFAACNLPGRNLPPADLFGAACRSLASSRIKAARERFATQTLGIKITKDPIFGLDLSQGNTDDRIDFGIRSYCAKQEACKVYATHAVDAGKISDARQCGNTGPRWQAPYDEHLRFCMNAPDALVKAEDQARGDGLSACEKCDVYVGLAMTQAKANITHQCGGTGPRWTLDRPAHLRFCESVPQAAMNAERDARNDFLIECIQRERNRNQPSEPPPPPQCEGGMTLTADGLCACPPGSVWNGRLCSSCPADRVVSNGQCVSCNPGTHAENGQCLADALPIGGAGGANVQPCTPDQRRGPDGICFSCSHEDHFDASGQCVPCRPGFHVQGDACVRDGGTGGAGPVPVPAQPVRCDPPLSGFKPNCQCPAYRPVGTPPNCCPVGTVFRDGVCRRPLGSGGSNGTQPGNPPICPASRPVGTYPNCCPAGTEFRGGVCRRPRGSGGSNGTQPGSPPTCPASRPVGTYPNCCPAGTEFRGGVCRRPRGSGGSNGTQPGSPPTCPAGRPVGVFPNCCPVGMEFSGGMCRRPRGSGGSNGTQPGSPPTCPAGRPVGVFPNCCPVGMEFSGGMCRRPRGNGGSNGTQPGSPPTCPAGRPVGTYPNCCPAGTEFRNGSCRRPGQSGGGSNGTQPGTNPPARTCPPGYRVLDKPNKYGAYCEIIPQPTTPAQPQPTPTKTCTRGMIGHYPICHCPAGQAMYAGRCRPQRPQPTGPTPSKVPADNCHYEDKCVKYKPNPGQIAPLCVETQKVKVCGTVSGPK